MTATLRVNAGPLRRQRQRARGRGEVAAAVIDDRDAHHVGHGRKRSARSGAAISSRAKASSAGCGRQDVHQQIAAPLQRPAAQVVAGQAQQEGDAGEQDRHGGSG